MDVKTRTWEETLKAAKGADLVLTDPPYGTTRNKWDTPPELSDFFASAWTSLKPTGVIAFTTAEPFTSRAILADKNFKYCWYWDKVLPTGHLNANRQPLRRVEPIPVFYRKQCTYNPIMGVDERGNRSWKRKNTSTGSYNDYGEHTYESKGQKYPTTVLSVYQPPKGKRHPTEKPVELIKYLITTYTNKGDIVVDPFMGTGATMKAAQELERRFIGGDIHEEYISIALS